MQNNHHHTLRPRANNLDTAQWDYSHLPEYDIDWGDTNADVTSDGEFEVGGSEVGTETSWVSTSSVLEAPVADHRDEAPYARRIRRYLEPGGKALAQADLAGYPSVRHGWCDLMSYTTSKRADAGRALQPGGASREGRCAVACRTAGSRLPRW